jgi:flagellar biosynthesis/type III secretory pathway protein FliH
LSKIIRHIVHAPSVFIGERQRDVLAENRAEKKLGELFPAVSFVTETTGERLIPISEVFQLEKILLQRCQEARQEGFAAGHVEGLERGRDEARTVLRNFDKAIKDAITDRARMLDEARAKILELVLKISRKVTFDAVEADRESSIIMINRVIDQLVDKSRLKIKVHPDHLPIMEQNINRFLQNSTAIKELTFEADPRVRMGGCFIETPSGDIDARLESEFEVIEDAILGVDQAE